MRIVTTLPSATELVAALGLEPVGVSHECDYPPRVDDRPVVTSSRIDADARSGEIDRQVLEAVSGGTGQGADEGDGDCGHEDGDGDESGHDHQHESEPTGVYDVHLETLEALDPDLIVTQGICDVCAVDEVVVERAVDRIDADPDLLTIDSHTIGGVLEDLRRIGRATGRVERAEAVIADLERRIEAVGERAGGDDEPGECPRVAIFDWTDPVMIAGHWMPELVTTAGGAYGMADPGERSSPREWETILAYDPEVLVVAPCGFGLEQTAANLPDLTDRNGWDDLAAVREGRAWAMDGHHYVNRPGPRLVDTLEYLAGIVQPERFAVPPTEVALPVDELESVTPSSSSLEV